MKRRKRLIDPRDPREPPTDEPMSAEERARRMGQLGLVLLQIARREGLLPPEEPPNARQDGAGAQTSERGAVDGETRAAFDETLVGDRHE